MEHSESHITLPAALPRLHRMVVVPVVVLFLGILVATGALEVFLPPSERRLVGEEKVRAEEAALDVNFRDGSLARSIETNFRLRGRVRRAVGPFWAVWMLALRDVPGRTLVIGADRYLFYRDRVDLDYPDRDDGAELLARLFSAVDRCLASRGTELIVAPLPRKAFTARAKLPAGIPFHPEYDTHVIAAMKAQGLRTLDLESAWSGTDASRLYSPHDSHWSREGVLSFANELRQQFPELPRDLVAVDYVDGPPQDKSGSLPHAGVFPRHPAYDWYQPKNDRMFVLLPGDSAQSAALSSPEVMLAGSSFSRGYFGGPILSHVLQAPVHDASVKGMPPLFSLQEGIGQLGASKLPRFCIAEFPVHQAASIQPSGGPTHRACYTAVNLLASDGRMEVVPERLIPAPTRLEAGEKLQLLRYPMGTFLTSGDGVLAVRIQVSSDAVTRWRYASSGSALPIMIPAGEQTRLLPIVEAEDATGQLLLSPTNEAAESATVRIDVVTNAALDRLRPLAVQTHPAEGALHEGSTLVAGHDALMITWEDATSEPIEIELTGTDSTGAPLRRKWTFPHPTASRLALLSLGALQGGQLQRVSVRGTGARTTMGLAPLLRP